MIKPALNISEIHLFLSLSLMCSNKLLSSSSLTGIFNKTSEDSLVSSFIPKQEGHSLHSGSSPSLKYIWANLSPVNTLMASPYPTDKIYICLHNWQNPQYSDFCQLLWVIITVKPQPHWCFRYGEISSVPQNHCSFSSLSCLSFFSPNSYTSLVSPLLFFLKALSE